MRRRVLPGPFLAHAQGPPLLLLEGVTGRNDIEALRGQKILVDRDLLPPVDDDEVYVEDVLGFAVMLPDGTRLGGAGSCGIPRRAGGLEHRDR